MLTRAKPRREILQYSLCPLLHPYCSLSRRRNLTLKIIQRIKFDGRRFIKAQICRTEEFNPSIPKISLEILLTVSLPYNSYDVSSDKLVLIPNNLKLNKYLYSHHLSSWYCINVVRRNSVLVTHGSLGVKEDLNFLVR